MMTNRTLMRQYSSLHQRNKWMNNVSFHFLFFQSSWKRVFYTNSPNICQIKIWCFLPFPLKFPNEKHSSENSLIFYTTVVFFLQIPPYTNMKEWRVMKKSDHHNIEISSLMIHIFITMKILYCYIHSKNKYDIFFFVLVNEKKM